MRSCLVLVLGLGLLWARTAGAESFTGSFRAKDGTVFRLEQNGTRISGVARYGVRENPVRGIITGTGFEFWFDFDGSGTPGPVRFTASLDGTTLNVNMGDETLALEREGPSPDPPRPPVGAAPSAATSPPGSIAVIGSPRQSESSARDAGGPGLAETIAWLAQKIPGAASVKTTQRTGDVAGSVVTAVVSDFRTDGCQLSWTQTVSYGQAHGTSRASISLRISDLDPTGISIDTLDRTWAENGSSAAPQFDPPVSVLSLVTLRGADLIKFSTDSGVSHGKTADLWFGSRDLAVRIQKALRHGAELCADGAPIVEPF